MVIERRKTARFAACPSMSNPVNRDLCTTIIPKPVIPLKIARHTPTPSFLRRQESSLRTLLASVIFVLWWCRWQPAWAIAMKIARHTPTPSFLRRQESIPGRCRGAGEDRSGHHHFHLLMWPLQGHGDSERSERSEESKRVFPKVVPYASSPPAGLTGVGKTKLQL